MGKEDFLPQVLEAEKLWEKSANRDLFTYTESEGIPVNLVFDERQERANEEAEYRDVLESKEDMSDSVKDNYESLLKEYESLKKKYESRVSTYEAKLATYNREVSMWNEKGGAPQNIFKELEETKRELAREVDSLNTLSKQLNVIVQQMNTLGARGNSLISDYNEVVEEYNDRFSEGGEFTQGDYQAQVINIYQFDSIDELIIVLAHEFGHALGIGHVTEETSIMYHLMEKQTLAIGVANEDVAALTLACSPDSFWVRAAKSVKGIIAGL